MEKSPRSVVFIRKVCFFEDFLGGPVNFIYLFWPGHAAWGVLEFPPTRDGTLHWVPPYIGNAES